jgi:hypothetical protein
MLKTLIEDEVTGRSCNDCDITKDAWRVLTTQTPDNPRVTNPEVTTRSRFDCDVTNTNPNPRVTWNWPRDASIRQGAGTTWRENNGGALKTMAAPWKQWRRPCNLSVVIVKIISSWNCCSFCVVVVALWVELWSVLAAPRLSQPREITPPRTVWILGRLCWQRCVADPVYWPAPAATVGCGCWQPYWWCRGAEYSVPGVDQG